MRKRHSNNAYKNEQGRTGKNLVRLWLSINFNVLSVNFPPFTSARPAPQSPDGNGKIWSVLNIFIIELLTFGK